jgi:hypothetical protein
MYDNTKRSDQKPKSLQRNVILDILSIVTPPSKNTIHMSFLDGGEFGMSNAVYNKYPKYLDNINIDIPNPEALQMTKTPAFKQLKKDFSNVPNVYPAHDSEFFSYCGDLKKQGTHTGYDMVWFDRCSNPDETLYTGIDGAIRCAKDNGYFILALTFCYRARSRSKTCMYANLAVTDLADKHSMKILNLPDLVGLSNNNYSYYTSIYVMRPQYEHYTWKQKLEARDLESIQKKDEKLSFNIRTMFHKRYFDKFNWDSENEEFAPWTIVRERIGDRKSKRKRGEEPDVPILNVKKQKSEMGKWLPKIYGRKYMQSAVYYKCKWGLAFYWVNIKDLCNKYGKSIVNIVYEYDMENAPIDGFIIQTILEKDQEKELYLVKWKNYPKEFNSWEPREAFNGCEKLLNKF